MTFNQITIVITSYKSDEKIFKCLQSINNQCLTIVIENSDNILFKEKIEKNFTNTKCIIAGENLGYAKGNNLGLSKVKTKFALILNPDAELKASALNNFLESANKIKNFAIIGPAAESEENIENQIKTITEVNAVKGFAMFLNLDEFKDIGFFDDNFFIYLEETDLCKRLRKKNKKIFIDPNIIIHHQGGSSHDEKYNFKMELSRNWHWMWSTFYYNKKYYGFSTAFLKILPKFIKSFFKYIFYSLTQNKDKKNIYFHRLSGIINSLIGRKSWYRPNL